MVSCNKITNKDARSSPWNDNKFAFIVAENNWISFFLKKWAVHPASKLILYVYVCTGTHIGFISGCPTKFISANYCCTVQLENAPH